MSDPSRTAPGDTTDVVPSPAAAELPSLERGHAVGRYLILDELGRGGMGVVYAAYDPDLDRKVAVKLVRGDALDEDKGTLRLLREGQAMARLAHPNVVTVFDVGVLGDRVFIAMELVDGTTLRDWLAAAPRGWREVLGVFRQAGAALAAAHSLGIVHRDFKPENVLIDRAGRVRVADFGLARATGSTVETAPGSPSGPLLDAVTRTGTIVGTPAYMAPEQRRGVVDARSDQYSFGVSLYEALHGRRPAAAAAGRAGASVPGWVAGAVARCLRERPGERFPSMEEALAALGREPWSRGRWLAGAAVLAAVAALGITRVVTSDREEICGGGPGLVAQVWNGPARDSLRAAFRSSGAPYAEDALRRAETTLEGYAGRWASAYGESCRATRVRREQSEELLDLRMVCLDERRAALGALTRVLGAAERKAVDRAVEAALALPRIEDCADVARLREPRPLPGDPAARARVTALRASLAEIRALEAAGLFAAGRERAEAAAREAGALGHRPTEAEALFALGTLETDLSRDVDAEATLRHALLAAEAGGHRVLAAQAAILLIRVVGYALAKREQGHEWAERAGALVEGLGDEPRLRAQLDNNVAGLFLAEDRLDEALQRYESSLQLRERALGRESPLVAASLTNIGLVHDARGEHAEAALFHRRALAIRERALGASHPTIGAYLNNLAAALIAQGLFGEALAADQRALAIQLAAFGPDGLAVAVTLVGIGNIHKRQGRLEAALEAHRRALAIKEKALGPDHPNVASSLGNLSVVLREMGRLPEAQDLAERALALQEKVSGPRSASVAYALNALANIAQDQRRFDAALEAYRRAIDIWRAVGDRPATAGPLLGVGETLLAQGQPRAALPPIEEALAIRTGTVTDPVEIAITKFHLGRALWDSGVDRKRAVALMHEARAKVVLDVDVRGIDDWLAGHHLR